MELKKHITDEQTGIGYTLCGDVRCISLVSEFSRLKEEAVELYSVLKKRKKHDIT